jgi:hypothetical protein
MINSKRYRNTVVSACLVLLVFAEGLCAQSPPEPAGDKLLQIIPAESLFCVRVNNFEYTLNTIDQFLMGVSPMPMGFSILARTQLAKVLGSPELNGVNMAGNFAAFAALTGKQTETNPILNIFVAVLIPVTDFQQLITSNPNCGPTDANGVSKITITDTSGKSNTMLTAQLDGYALISSANNYDKLITIAKSISTAKPSGLASVLDAAETKPAMNEPLWAYGNVQLASKTFGPLVFGQLEKIKTMMEGMKSSGQGPMGNPAAVMNMYTKLLELLMKEMQSLSLTVKPAPNACNLTISASAVAGTDMANMLVADASADQENKLLGYLEDGAAMNLAFKMNKTFWNQLNNKGIDIIAAVADTNTTAENITKLKTLAADSLSAIGNSMVCSFSTNTETKPPFAAKYVIDVNDQKTFDRVMEEAAEMMNSGPLADLNKSMGMETSYTIQRAVDIYKGVSIDSARLVMKSTEPNSPQGQMLDKMYGGGIEYRWGMVKVAGLCACVIGGDANSAIHQLIDEVKASRQKPMQQQLADEVKAALELLPQANKADFVGTYNFLRLLKMTTAMAPVPIPQMDIQTKSNVAFSGKIGNGRMTMDIALPKEHLTEIVAAVQTMKLQQETAEQPPSAKDTKPDKNQADSQPVDIHDAIWVKCKNPNCGAEYQMSQTAYYKYLGKHRDPASPKTPSPVCKICGQESIALAVKCEKCGSVFFKGAVPHDFADKCPKCNYSKTEEERKKARQQEQAE